MTYIIEKPTGFQGYVTMAEKFNPITGEWLGQYPVPEHFKPGKPEITVIGAPISLPDLEGKAKGAFTGALPDKWQHPALPDSDAGMWKKAPPAFQQLTGKFR